MNPFFIEANESNINEVLAQSQTTPLVLTFYASQFPESLEVLEQLKQKAQQMAGQFVLAAVNCEESQRIAAQFRLSTLPTTYLFKESQALDAFTGKISDEELTKRLTLILPKEEDLLFQEALSHIEKGELNEAIPLLKKAWDLSNKNAEIAFIFAETYLTLKRADNAEDILNQVKLEDRNSDWQALVSQVELLKQAADTPEIQGLQAIYHQEPSAKNALPLAQAIQQVGKNEEALALLFEHLQKDLAAEEGEVKKAFLTIVNALNGDSLANLYRRKLYSLLY